MNPESESLLAKSKENFELALDLKDDEKYNAAANRFYYSIFQAVKAYAIEKGKMSMEGRKEVHSSALRLVRAENEDYYETMSEACNLRAKADYLAESIEKNELSLNFINKVQDVRNHFQSLARSA